MRDGGFPDLDTDWKKSVRQNVPVDGEGGGRETKTILCQAECGDAQIGGDGDTLEVLHNQHPERICLNGVLFPV